MIQQFSIVQRLILMRRPTAFSSTSTAGIQSGNAAGKELMRDLVGNMSFLLMIARKVCL
jgi:hypothetical protein